MAFEDRAALLSMLPELKEQILREVPQALRESVSREFDSRTSDLVGRASADSAGSFSGLLGLGPAGPPDFDKITWPEIEADFDASIIKTQIQAAAELYF